MIKSYKRKWKIELQEKLKRTKTKQKLRMPSRSIFSKAPIISQNLQGRFVRKVDNAGLLSLYKSLSSGKRIYQGRTRSIKGSRLDPFSRNNYFMRQREYVEILSTRQILRVSQFDKEIVFLTAAGSARSAERLTAEREV